MQGVAIARLRQGAINSEGLGLYCLSDSSERFRGVHGPPYPNMQSQEDTEVIMLDVSFNMSVRCEREYGRQAEKVQASRERVERQEELAEVLR